MATVQQHQNKANEPDASLGSHLIQPKLKIGQPGDKYEQEADRVADAVMRMPDQQVQRLPVEEEKEALQMQPLEEEEELQMKCKECEEKEKMRMKPAIQMMQGEAYTSPNITGQINASKGQGRPLAPNLQQEMSSKIGADFSHVSVHTDSRAAQMNEQLGARAFTYGNDIYFNKGEYHPASDSGKYLLAHELTHVVQQGQSNVLNRNIIQRAIQIPAGVAAALAAAGRFLLSCVIGAAFGVGLDYVWQRGAAWWNEQEFRWNSCSAIVSGIIGCVSAGVGSILARAIFRHTGGHLERDFATKAVVWFITWLYSKFPVVPVAIIMKFLINMGCVDESEVPGEMRDAA